MLLPKHKANFGMRCSISSSSTYLQVDLTSYMTTRVCPIPEMANLLIFVLRFFTALPPSLRSAWGDRMRQLIRPGGYLIALVWPIDGSRPGGPPHSVSVELMQKALSAGWEKVADFVPKTGHEDHLERQRLAVWKRIQPSNEGE